MAQTRLRGIETSFPDEEYECKICYNNFDSDRHTPKILECLHTFCEECLNTVHLREDRGWRIGCPLCRRRTPVPEYRIQNLPINTKVTDALHFHFEADLLPQESVPPDRPPLHPALVAAYRREEADAASSHSQSFTNDSGASESCHRCSRVLLTTGCVCAILSFLSMLGLMFLGLIFVHNFNNPPSPIGPICLSVASILAMFSVIVTWLLCWLKYRPELDSTAGSAGSYADRRNAL